MEGDRSPDIRIVNDEGEEVGLGSLRGKVVLIDFWATWCGPCVSRLPQLQEIHAKYHDRGLEIVGVHVVSGASALPEFLGKHPLPWRVTVDHDGTVSPIFNVKAIPTFFLIDRTGTLRVAGLSSLGLEEAIGRLLDEDSTDQATPIKADSE